MVGRQRLGFSGPKAEALLAFFRKRARKIILPPVLVGVSPLTASVQWRRQGQLDRRDFVRAYDVSSLVFLRD
ncbi:hypothetical protein CBM2609_A140002 [Cupriavidus taiwanensis]|nr:hypothetical protein CBM2604_A120002 [Cupriavidus taiwanensis]SOZ25277.1 hypothetical protein CBM2609_A140002 [Cupriavidus taiwanensis]SOZ44528.1 hypothetical protein CBM2610_A150002 [Cupriavidus taiwanensis]